MFDVKTVDLSNVKIRFINEDDTDNEFEATRSRLAVPCKMLDALIAWEATNAYRCNDFDPSDDTYCFSSINGEGREWWLHVHDCIVESQEQ